MANPALLGIALIQVTAQQPLNLTSRSDFDTTITPGSAHQYVVLLEAGASANIVFRQMGVDLVVEVHDPNGKLLTTIDSPNGRTGDEPVEIIAAAAGAYGLRVRPYGPQEPAGRYHVTVAALRDARATNDMLAARTQARDAASTWLGGRTAAVTRRADSSALAAKFDSVARRARVIGLGEATHGSREFGDARVWLTKRAIERAGYRIVAIEASAARLRRLNMEISSRGRPNAATQLPEGGLHWIGSRAEGELVRWLRTWNARNPGDAVALVGVDDQDFHYDLANLGSYLRRAYGDRVAGTWAAIERELARADSQAYVFRNSSVDSTFRRQLFELAAILKFDEPVLRRLHGDSAYDRAAATLTIAAQFADFNDGSSGVVSHDRDWYMAANLLSALSSRRQAKALLWAHNSHIAHRSGRTALNGPSGTVLRETLGCDYQAIAMTFGEGAFLAQLPSDPANRLAVDSLGPNVDESVERVMGRAASATTLAVWGCVNDTTQVPQWLQLPQRMRSIGGVWRPGSNPADANWPTRLIRDYDGLLYIPRVTAETAPTFWPRDTTRR